MNQPHPSSRSVAIIGAGITGLAAAHRLIELNPDTKVTLFEASDRLGGILYTQRQEDFLIEHAADMFTTKQPWALDLCRRIGFDDQLIQTNPDYRRAYIVNRGRLVRVPEGFSLMSPVRFLADRNYTPIELGRQAATGWGIFCSGKA